jgi:hypothetical protein
MRAAEYFRVARLSLRSVSCLAAVVLCAATAFAQANSSSSTSSPDQSAPDTKSDQKSSQVHSAKLRIRVTTNDGKPVANASVYVRYNTSGGFMHHDKLAEMDFKTNQDGSVKVPDVPQGKVLIQVIAKNWHTFGKWYEIEKDEETIAIQLEPPPHWY